jgi:isoamylase
VHGPYAPKIFGYTIGSPDDDLSLDDRDSAPFMPKCRVIDSAFTWGNDRAPAIPWDRAIIYETHVKGMTQRHPAVPHELRGTVSGTAHHAIVNYLRNLGVLSL